MTNAQPSNANAPQSHIVGRYNAEGYTIYNLTSGNALYSAGNSWDNSDDVEDPDESELAIPLDTLRGLCETMGEVIAERHGDIWDGVELGEREQMNNTQSFPCPMCQRTFSNAQDLDDHCNTHSLADHAEAWYRDVEHKAIPLRKGVAWKLMYQQWIEYGFAKE